MDNGDSEMCAASSSSSSGARPGSSQYASKTYPDKKFGENYNPNDIEVRVVDDSIGRGVFAKRKFTKGEIVLMDSPIIAAQYAWNYKYAYRACEYCLRPLETAEENCRRLTGLPAFDLPYPECCETRKELHVSCDACEAEYCTIQCREKAFEEYHSILCFQSKDPPEAHPLKALDLFWRLGHYPPETSNILLMVKLLAKIHLDKTGTIRERLAQSCQSPTSANMELAHKMLGEEFEDRIEKLRGLVAAVINFDDIQEYLTKDGFLKLFVLVGRNGQGVGTSAFAYWVENAEKLELDDSMKTLLSANINEMYSAMEDHVGHFLDNEGCALYPTQSWVNHSCVPNTEVKFPYRNCVLGLVATKDIEPGEEVLISYLDLEDLNRSRYTRNKYLKEHYLFVCTCEKCIEQADQEDISSSEDEDEDEEMDEDEDFSDEDIIVQHQP